MPDTLPPGEHINNPGTLQGSSGLWQEMSPCPSSDSAPEPPPTVTLLHSPCSHISSSVPTSIKPKRDPEGPSLSPSTKSMKVSPPALPVIHLWPTVNAKSICHHILPLGNKTRKLVHSLYKALVTFGFLQSLCHDAFPTSLDIIISFTQTQKQKQFGFKL